MSGLLVAPESTGVTRVLYSVPASSPVMVEEVPDALAANVVHAESDDFLYSTLYPVTPAGSCGAVHVNDNCVVLPVVALPDLDAVSEPTLLAPRSVLVQS